MDIKRLRYFINVVDKGSIGRAAIFAAIAQPAMSQHMSVIEDYVGVKLLVRSPQGVSPTPAGVRFYRCAHAIVRRFDEGRREAAAIGGRNAGTLSIGIPTSMLGIIGAEILNSLMARFPSLHVKMLEGLSGHLIEMAQNGRIDIVFAFVDHAVSGLNIRPLLVEELFLIQPFVTVAEDCVKLAEVGDIPLVLPGPEHGLRKAVELGLAKIGREPKLVAEIDSFPLLLNSVRQGLASTIISWAGMTNRLAPNDVRKRRIVEPPLTRPVAMCFSENAMMIEHIEDVASIIEALFRRLVDNKLWLSVRYVGAR